jgi:retron-type reverse transcriptase
VIRSNAARSGSRETRLAAEAFEEHLLANIQNIQRRLKYRNFKFKPALGIATHKGDGKTGKRAIVVATVADRVVQRAILDVVYEHCTSPEMTTVLCTPTSVGGVPGRGIGHALALIERAEDFGATYAIRSDIRNFFPSFPRKEVIRYFRDQIADRDFVELFENAINVVLSNKVALGEDADLFPLGDDGVAQGSPLSVLAGNIVLRQFDAELNRRDVVCVRYIDDFLILAKNAKAAHKALASGLAILKSLKLNAYEPNDGSGKAWEGSLAGGFDFLGYKVVRGLNPPSAASRDKLVTRIGSEISEGKKWISRVLKDDHPQTKKLQCYVQTLSQIDGILRGWAGAFQHSMSVQTFADLDARIDVQLAEFEKWFGYTVRKQGAAGYRRALGVRLLGDSAAVPLPEIET